MNINDQNKLAVIITQESEALLLKWRQQVRQFPSAQHLDTPTLNDHLPSLLKELAAALQTKSDEMIPEVLSKGSPPAHGIQRVEDGFDIAEVVGEYNIMRRCIYDLADDNGFVLQGKLLHTINQVFDEAIGLAVETFATQRALEVQERREEYLAFLAHDLRTPLNAISLVTDILPLTLSGKVNSDKTEQVLKILRRNVQRLVELVSKLLEENANLQTEIGIKLEQRELDVWPIVEDLIHDLYPMSSDSNVQLINRVPDNLVAYADASLLKRIFQNLIVNAIKFSPHGEVIIGAQELINEGVVKCWVSDNGAGIPSDTLEKIFDKGETELANEGGTGLGLAIVKAFVESHGGTVSVESKEGFGSTFQFLLPSKA